MYTYPIDLDLFTPEEVVILIEFMAMIEDANENGKIDKDAIVKKHNNFRKVINSVSIEKQIDKDFKKVSGYSIFQTMKRYK